MRNQKWRPLISCNMDRKTGVDSKRSVLSDTFSAQVRRSVIVNVSENFEMPGMSRKGRGRTSRIGALSAAGSKSSSGPLGRKARGPGASVVGDSDSRSSTPVSVASASRNSARLGLTGKSRTTPGVPRKKTRRFMEDVVDDEDEDLAMDVDFHDAEDSRTNSDADDEEVHEELEDSFDETGSVWSEASDSTSVSLASKLKLLPRRPKSPEFDDDEEIPALQPPESSIDLFIEGQNLMEAVGIYEVLRHFSANVRLSPFRFEEFCAALCTDEQSNLLAEMHIMLLRALLREDDGNNTLFGPQDVKDSINIQLFMIDPMTWYENVRAYLDSDPSPEFTQSLPAMEKTSYSSMTIAERLHILGTLTNLFLATNPVREGIFTNEGSTHYDDICRSCHRVGDLLCCDTCSAVYHLPCLDLPEVPEDEWICGVCRLHQVKGISDCMSEAEKGGLLCRQEPIGYDRHRRKYWFLCRRIIVEGEDDVRYYSTPLQLEELIETLDSEKYERDLVTGLVEMKDEITRQMTITEELTKENQGTRKSAIETTNANLLKLRSERAAKLEEEKIKKQDEEENAVEASADGIEAKKEDKDESDIHMEVEEIKDEFSQTSTVTSEVVSSQSVTSMNESTTVNIEPKKEVVEVKEVTTVITSTTTTVTSTTVTQNALDSEKLKTDLEAVKSEAEDVEVKPESIKSKIEALGSRFAPKTMVVITKDGGKLMVPLPRPNTNGADTTAVTESSSQESSSSTSVTSEGRRIVTRSKTGSLTPKQFVDSITISMTTAKSTSKDEGILSRDGDGVRLTRSRTTMSASAFLLSQSIYFKLGAEGSFKLYQNQYSTNPLALSKNQHNEEREKKRHLSHKFSLTPVSEFTWSGSAFGACSVMLGTLRQNLLQLETNFPAPLLHPNWPQHRARWTKLVNAAIRPEDFANVLGMLESSMKPVLFNQVWHEALGHTRLRRTPVLDRDEVKKRDRELRRRKDEEEEPGKNTWVKYSLGIRHTVWKQKGEEYRVLGQGGWLWTSCTRTTRFAPATSYGLRALAAKLQARKQKALEKRKAAEEGKLPDQEDGRGEEAEGKKENGRKEGFLSEKSGLMVMEEDGEEAKEADVEEDVPEIKIVLENFDISKALVNRTHYARITKPYSRLEHLLDRRLKQAELEQKQKSLFEQLIQHYRSEQRKKAKQIEEAMGNNVDMTAEVALPPAKTVAVSESGITGVAKYQCYSATCRGGGHDSKSCYSVLCCDLGVRPRTGQNLMDALPNLDLTNGDLDDAGSEEDGCNNNEVCLENEDKDDGMTGQANNCEDSSDSTKMKNRVLNETEKQILAKSLKHDSREQPIKVEAPPLSSELPGKPAVLASDGDIALVSLSSFLQNGKLQLTPDLITQLEVRLARMGRTELPVHLTKRGPGRPAKSATGAKAAGLLKKGAIPSVHRFLTPSKKTSLFVLRRHFLSSLARHEGKRETTGFNYACKMNNVNWPYPCPRPYFKTAWEYRTQTMQNLPAVGVQLRILWACLRWDDLAAKPPASGTNTVTTDADITTTKILKRRDVGPYGLRSEFLVRKIVIPISVPSQPREKYTPQRSGLRERRRPESPKHKEPSVTEAWLPEEQLELWEIKLFGDRIEKQNLVALEKKAQQQKQAAAEAQKSTTDSKSQIEEQLRLQRQTTGLKRTADGQLKTPDTTVKTSVVRIIQTPTQGGVGVKTLPFSTSSLIPSSVGSGIHTIQIQQPNRSLLMNTSSLLAPATAATTPTQQNVQSLRIIQGPNGQLQVQGLLPGQQILRLPDGRLHLIPGTARPLSQQPVVVQTKTPSSLPLATQSGSDVSAETPSSTNLVLTGTNVMTNQVELSAASSSNPTTQRFVLTGGSILSQSVAGARPTAALPKVVMAASGSLALAGQRQHMLVTTPKVVKVPQQQLTNQAQQATRVMLPSGQMVSGQSTVVRTASGQHFIIHSNVPAAAAAASQQKPLVPSNVADAVTGGGTAPVATDSPSSLTTCLSLSTSPSGMSPTKYTLTPQVLQQVVSQALMQTQDPDIQAKLLAMQKVMQQQQQLTPPSSASSSDANTAATPQQQHSHLLQVKQQQLSIQVPGASALATTPVKKGLSQEQKEEQARLAACNHVIKNLLDSVDKQERHELKRQRKQETSDEKSKRLQHQKLDAQVTKRKEALKREMLKKRSNLEKTITAKLQAELAKAVEARQPRKVVHPKRPRTDATPKVDLTPSMPLMAILASDSIVSTPPVACELEVKEPKAKRRKNRLAASARGGNVKTEASDDQLYCLCKKPYDESKFYIGCDRCEGWFHGSCVGVTKSEADHMDTYVCPLCHAASGDNAMNQTRLQDHHQVELRKLINIVKTHRMSWPFREPVSPKDVPDYYMIIKEPMDLSTVESNLVSHRYTTLGEFVKDVTKIFDNCRYYNPSSSQFYRCAETLEVYFVDKLKALKEKLKI